MNETKFKSEMNRAKTMQQIGDNADYWIGYQRGLRRAYHGESFGTESEHKQWLNNVDERGAGYRDALAYAESLPGAGRPSLYGEKSVPIQFRISESQAEKLGSTSTERNEKAKNIVMDYINK